MEGAINKDNDALSNVLLSQASASSSMKSMYEIVYGTCRVALEVDQPSGSTYLLEADQTTGSSYL